MKKILFFLALALGFCSCNKFNGNISEFDEGTVTAVEHSTTVDLTLNHSCLSYVLTDGKDYIYNRNIEVGDYVFISRRDDKFLVSACSAVQMQLAKEIINRNFSRINVFSLLVILLAVCFSASVSNLTRNFRSRMNQSLVYILVFVLVPVLLTLGLGKRTTLELVTSGTIEQLADNKVMIDRQEYVLNSDRDLADMKPLQINQTVCLVKADEGLYATAQNIKNIDGEKIFRNRYSVQPAIIYLCLFLIFGTIKKAFPTKNIWFKPS